SQDQTLPFNPLSYPAALAARLTHSESSVYYFLRFFVSVSFSRFGAHRSRNVLDNNIKQCLVCQHFF
ncbi:MAG: hypothetical protein IKB78_01155, partial [Clostridia bacterium]|nr:hypothetical protein [Clostridia bacterium]